MNNKAKILIVGGGFAGARAAQELSIKGFTDVTLVDRKGYFEVTYAVLRGVTEPDNWGKRSRIAYADFIQGRFIQASVTELTDSIAKLDNGDSLAFDYAIVATGSSYGSFPIAKSNEALSITARESEISTHYQKLNESSSALIIGGGPVGVEFAGELADYFPQLDVTLVHGGKALLDSFSDKAGSVALKKLRELGVTVKLDTRLEANENGRYQVVGSNDSLSADLVYECIGSKPHNEMLKKHFADCINSDGRLRVDITLRVIGHPHIFAVGDIADVDELKLGYLAGIQGTAVAQNLALLVRGKSLKNYKTNPKMALVPVGRKTGLVQLPFGVTSLKFMVNMKQKDLFISKSFKTLGVDKKNWPKPS